MASGHQERKYDPDEIHDVESAAKRAKVREADILRWIADGMRAKPVGKVSSRGPRNYRILDKWLMAYIEADSEVATAPAPLAVPVRGRAGRPRVKAGVPGGADPIGPIVWKEGR